MFIGTGLGHYLTVLRRWLWLIVLVVLVCTGITYGVNTITTPVYEATALIQVHDAGEANSSVFTDQALAQSYALLVTSPDVLQAVTQKVPGTSVRKLESQVSDSPLDNTQIIQVRASAKSPELAAEIANNVVSSFITIQSTETNTQLRGVAAKLYINLSKAKQTVDADQTQLAMLEDNHAPDEQVARQNDILNNDQLNYSSLQANYNQVEQQLLQVSNILTVAQPATPPSTASSPHTLLDTIIAGIASLLVMIIFVLILDWINTTIKTPDDVEQMTQVNALGSIPFQKGNKNSVATALPLTNNEVVEHAFVGISTNIAMTINGKRSLLVTGTHTQVGTSTAAANLAISLARSGVRVLLVDANLQHPMLHKVFQNANQRGLTTTLTDMGLFQNATPQQVYTWLTQWNTKVPNLWFLPSGPPPANGAIVLRSPVMRLFLKCLLQPVQHSVDTPPTSLVDIIIFDAAPLDDGSDTLALASFTSASILVVEAGKDQASLVQKAQATLQKMYSPLLGVIVNKRKAHYQPYFYASRSRRLAQNEQDEHTNRIQPSFSSLKMRAVHASSINTPNPQEQQTVPDSKVPALLTPRSPVSSGLGIGPLLNATRVDNEASNHKG